MTQQSFNKVENLNSKTIKEIQGLVLAKDLDESFIIDLKYATKDNFVNKAVYPVAVCVIRRETGEKLVKAHRIFKEKGYTIKIWDAYRPLHVQRVFYEACPNPDFIAKPPTQPMTSGFRPSHSNGMSVDITLVDSAGEDIEMPTEFDDFTDRASAKSKDMTDAARENVDYLVKVMESFGFKNDECEWWHFNDIVETPSPYLDIPLEDFLKLEAVNEEDI